MQALFYTARVGISCFLRQHSQSYALARAELHLLYYFAKKCRSFAGGL